MESIASSSLEDSETTRLDGERHLTAAKVKKVRSKQLQPKKVHSKKVSVRRFYCKNIARGHARQLNGDVYLFREINIHIPQVDRAERLQSFCASAIENLIEDVIARSLRRDSTSIPNEVTVEGTEQLHAASRLQHLAMQYHELDATRFASDFSTYRVLPPELSSPQLQKRGKVPRRNYSLKFRAGWTSCFFDITFSTSCHGLEIWLVTYNLVPRESKIFELCEDGDIGGLQDLFATGQASARDARDLGYCHQMPFHVAVQRGDLNLCKFLLQLTGLKRDMYPALEIWCSFYAEHTKGSTPESTKSSHMDILRLLLDDFDLDPEDVPSLKKVVPSGWISEIPVV